MRLTRFGIVRTTLATLLAAAVVAAFALPGFAQSSTKSSSGSKNTTSTKSSTTDDSSKRKGYLGVTTQTLTDELRDGLGYTYNGDGALVNGVMDDSPADKAGIVKGDLIVNVGSRAITSSESLSDRIKAQKEGDVVQIKVMRKGGAKTLSVKLSGRDEDDDSDNDSFSWDGTPAPPAPPAPPMAPRMHYYRFNGDMSGLRNLPNVMWMGTRGRLGVSVEDMVPEMSDYFKGTNGKGVLIKGVNDDTPASRAGFKVGDVITKVGDNTVDDTDDLMRALRKVDDGKVPVTVVRKGATQVLTPTLEKRESDIYMRTPSTRVHIDDQDMSDLRRQMDDLKRQMEDLKKDLKGRTGD